MRIILHVETAKRRNSLDPQIHYNYPCCSHGSSQFNVNDLNLHHIQFLFNILFFRMVLNGSALPNTLFFYDASYPIRKSVEMIRIADPLFQTHSAKCLGNPITQSTRVSLLAVEEICFWPFGKLNLCDYVTNTKKKHIELY